MEPRLDTRNLNALWAGVMVETLVRTGVERAVISPGSRSTPLTLAFAGHPRIRAVPVLDERSAGFLALGLAKASGRPVVLLCTSGTAAANYLPAVIEAWESRVPLIVLSADRPPELRACASGQTIDQQKLFGGHVEFFHELAVPEASLACFRYLRQTLGQAVARAAGGVTAGPVHLNVPFRDPLPPLPDDGTAAALAERLGGEAFFAHLSPPVRPRLTAAWPELPAARRGVIVAGPAQPSDPAAFVAAVAALAGRLGWPVLADGLTPLREAGGRIPGLVTTYDLILRSPEAAAALRPEVVLALGAWPTSKVLRAWVETAEVPVWLVTERPDNRDSLHGRTRVVPATVEQLADLPLGGVGDPAYRGLWQRHEALARTELDGWMEAEHRLFEPKAAWLLARHLPEETPLFIANSMPIRDVEYVWPPGDHGIRIWCNRGANGIDGTLSSALGVAEASGRPAVLLTGDLAFLHDANGLLLAPQLAASLTVIVINNRGGGIFEHLPVAQFDPPFEAFFATPQAVDLGRLAGAHGIPHEVVRDWATLVARISVLPARGLRILELPTDRKQDAAGRRRLFSGMAAAKAAAAGQSR